MGAALPGTDDDVLILGAGLAGLSAALSLAPLRVRVASLDPPGQGGSSPWAQGGIAAALDLDDSATAHGADTLAAGAGLCDATAVQALTQAAPDLIRFLEDHGARFDRGANGTYALGREAAHGKSRILHAGGDQTGRWITTALARAAQAAPHIRFSTGLAARALIGGAGAAAGGLICEDRHGHLISLRARHVIIAGGGLGGLFAVTTNPLSQSGEVFGLLLRAGLTARDPEFMQFHPTALDLGLDPAPLASEALRGAGASLRLADGTALMAGRHPLGDLAPRDIVARAIGDAMVKGQRVTLDLRPLAHDLASRFPAIAATARAAGLDPASDLLPVAPAAHYHMGGIAAAPDGRTALPGLWVIGEAAATGVHGANRLASNSLLEAVAMGRAAALAITAGPLPAARPLAWPAVISGAADSSAVARLRAAMSRHFGLSRDHQGLVSLLASLAAIRNQAPVTTALQNRLAAANMMAAAALMRRESRGAHARSDFPDPLPKARSSFLNQQDVEAIAANHLAPLQGQPARLRTPA